VKVRLAAFTQKEVKGFSTPEPSMYYSCEELRRGWDKDNILMEGWEVVVAKKRRKIVGFIVFKLEQDCGIIENINVAKGQQGKGVGRALVSHVEDTAESAGISTMKTDTTENAASTPWKSYAFWTKMGYKDTGQRLSTKYDFKEIPFVKNLKKENKHPPPRVGEANKTHVVN